MLNRYKFACKKTEDMLNYYVENFELILTYNKEAIDN